MRRQRKLIVGLFVLGFISIASAQPITTQDGLQFALSESGSLFEGLTIAEKQWQLSTEKTGLFIRDYNGDKVFYRIPIQIEHQESRIILSGYQPELAVLLEAEITVREHYIRIDGHIENRWKDRDRAVTLKLGIGLAEKDLTWSNGLLQQEPIENYSDFRGDRIPIAAVTGPGGGLTVAIPHDSPALFSVQYGYEQLAVHWKFGLTQQTVKFPNRAHFAMVIYSHDSAWGFRDALRQYHAMTPDAYDRSTPRAGLWSFMTGTPFEKYPHDFAFHEAGGGELETVIPREMNPRNRDLMMPPDQRTGVSGDHPIGWLKANSAREFGIWNGLETTQKLGIYFFPYMIVGQRQIYMLPGKMPPEEYGYQMEMLDAWDVRDILKFQSPGPSASFNSVPELKQIIRTSTLHHPDGRYVIQPRRYYGSTLTFVQNPDPDLFYDRNVMTMGKYSLDYMEMFERELPEIGGVYLDSFGKWLDYNNYRSEHFRYTDIPLSYDEEGRVVLPNKFPHYEYAVEAAQRLHAGGRYLMANGIHSTRFFIAAQVDVAGSEPGSLGWGKYVYYRTAMGQKPFAALERHYREDEYIEQSLKRATVFNIFYSFDPSYYVMKHLTYKTELLHSKYVHVWQKLYNAGWEPVTLARTDTEGIMLERYGSADSDRFFVIYNDAESTKSFTILFEQHAELGSVTQLKDIMDTDFLQTVRDTGNQYTVTLTLERDQLRVLKIR